MGKIPPISPIPPAEQNHEGNCQRSTGDVHIRYVSDKWIKKEKLIVVLVSDLIALTASYFGMMALYSPSYADAPAFKGGCWLCLSEKEATRYYTEYWRPKRLHSIYKEIKGDLSLILKLYRLLKREGIRTKDLEWFVHMVNTGMYKIPEVQKQYAKVKDEIEAIDYKKTMAKYELQNINNQITYLNRISYSKRNEIAYLKVGVQELEGYVHGLGNHNQ